MLLNEEQIKEAIASTMPVVLDALKKQLGQIALEQAGDALATVMRSQIGVAIADRFTDEIVTTLGEALIEDLKRRLTNKTERAALFGKIFEVSRY